MPDDPKSKTEPSANVGASSTLPASQGTLENQGVSTGTTAPEVKPTSVRDAAATPEAPESQLAREGAAQIEIENRRTKIASDLLQQRHGLIENFGGLMLVAIIALYIIFGVTIGTLLWSGRAFDQSIPVTAVVLVGMSGSVPTILSISLMLGLLAKEKDAKDEKSAFDGSTLTKVCIELIKQIKAPH